MNAKKARVFSHYSYISAGVLVATVQESPEGGHVTADNGGQPVAVVWQAGPLPRSRDDHVEDPAVTSVPQNGLLHRL